MDTAFDIAAHLEPYRSAPPSELTGAMRDFGLKPVGKVLDLGWGNASSALAAEGWRAEIVHPSQGTQIPGPAGAYDAAIASDVLHLLDQPAVLAELRRVVKPGGLIVAGWRVLPQDSDLLALRGAASRAAGLPPVPEPLRGGFRAFYGAEFPETTIRIIPNTLRITVADWLSYELTRPEVAAELGANAQRWHDALARAFAEKFASPNVTIDARLHYYAYLART